MEATVSSRISLLSTGAIDFCPSENKIVASSDSGRGLTPIFATKDFQKQSHFVDQNKNSISNSYSTLNGNKEKSVVNPNKEKIRTIGSNDRDIENDNSYLSQNGNKEKSLGIAGISNCNDKSVKNDKSYLTLNGNKNKALVNSSKEKIVANNCKERVVDDGIPVPKQIIYSGKIQVSWRQPRKIGAGLENLGNTCFINTVIQCLTYCPPLANHLLYETDHSAKCTIVGFCMMCLLQRHIKKALNSSNEVIRPVEVCGKLRSIAKHFQHGRQEDAHEFLRYVIENLWRSCLMQNNVSSKLDSASKETTIINQIFGGYHRSQVMCSRCKERSNTYDHFMDFILDIKQNVLTLDAALKKFTEPEVLDNDNAYKCPKCKMKVPALKKFTVHKAPNVATFQLKRFDYNRSFGGKITKQITYPDVLNLRPYMSETKGDPVLYHLNAVLVHSGHTCNSGHYYCYVKNSDGSWYIMDDQRVHRVNINQVLSQSAYVLFYVKSTPAETFPFKKSFENGVACKKIDMNVCNNKRQAEVSSSKPLVQNNQFRPSSPKQKQQPYPTINLNKRNGLSPNVNNREKISFGIRSQATKPQEGNSSTPNRIHFHVNTPKTENHQPGLVPYIEDSSDSSDDNDTVKLNSNFATTPSPGNFVGSSNSLSSSASSKSQSFTGFNIKRKQLPRPVLNANRLSNSGSSSSTSPKVIATGVWTVTDARSESPGADSNSSVHSTTDWHVTLSDSEQRAPEGREEKVDSERRASGVREDSERRASQVREDSERCDSEVRFEKADSTTDMEKCKLTAQNGGVLVSANKGVSADHYRNGLGDTGKQHDFRRQENKYGSVLYAKEEKYPESPLLKRKCSDPDQELPTNSQLRVSEDQPSSVSKKIKLESDSVNSEGPVPKKFKSDSELVRNESCGVDSHNKLLKFPKKMYSSEFTSQSVVSPNKISESSNYKSPKKTDLRCEANSRENAKDKLEASKNSANCSNSSNSSFEYEWVEKTNDSSHRSFKVSCTTNLPQEV